MDSNQQIKLGVIISYLSITINIITGLVFTPWIIRSLGRENFGLYTLSSSVIAFFMFDFGLSSSITRFVSKYLAEGKLDKANNCIGLVYKIYLYIDILFFIILSVLFFYIPDIFQKLTPEEIVKFKVVYVIAAIYSVFAFPFIPLNGILNANEKFVPLQLADLSQKIIIVVLMSLCLIAGFGLYALVCVNAIAGISTILLKLLAIKKYTNMIAAFHYTNKAEFKEIIGFSGWSTLVSLSQRFILAIVPSLLGVLSGSVAIAIFGIAMTIEGYSYTFSSVIGSQFLPKVSRITTKDDEGLLPLMIKVGRIQYVTVAAIVIGFICLGAHFVSLWVGDGFNDSYVCAVFMILPSFLMTPEEIANQTILAKNKVKEQAFAYLLTSALNLLLLWIFAAEWGALGAAWSICISYLCRWILLNIIYYKKLKLNVFRFYSETLLKMSPAFIVTFILCIFLNTIVEGMTWLSFIIKGLVFAVIYILSICIIMNKYERGLFLSPILSVYNKYGKNKNG